MLKKILLLLILFIVLIVFLLVYKGIPMFRIASGYAAKCACSNVYLNNRPLDDILEVDLALLPVPVTLTRDDKAQSIEASVYGMGAQQAYYKGDLGCVLVHGDDDYSITYDDPIDMTSDTLLFPYGNKIPDEKVRGIDYHKIAAAVNDAFDENRNYTDQKTRAIVVVYKDSLVMESYGNGNDKDTKIIGWSMTKSLVNTMIGMLKMDGKLSLDDNNLFPEWAGDDRKHITIDDLMHMDSGLDWDESYDKVADATVMLYGSEDVVDKALLAPAKYKPGEKWYYSSGTTNILSGLIRGKFNINEAYLDYPHSRIFNKIGMEGAVMEIDEAGNYIGSSYSYATARDWARYGLLYLNDGIWNGERLLPEGWVEYTYQAAPDSDGRYGAQWWLNKGNKYFPDVPADMFAASGFQGQKVAVIPSKDLVIVRLGYNSDFDFNGFISRICDAVE